MTLGAVNRIRRDGMPLPIQNLAPNASSAGAQIRRGGHGVRSWRAALFEARMLLVEIDCSGMAVAAMAKASTRTRDGRDVVFRA
jgi:hypothetical protein